MASSVVWPAATEYMQAIQNPQHCFSDTDLKLGKAKENLLGPVPITGAFASVYQVTTPTGRWAVRCFLTQVGDHRRRYAAISDQLHNIHLKYAVRFEYIEQGIRIKGQWYPILKMEWIDGDPLDSFVAKNLNQPARLLQRDPPADTADDTHALGPGGQSIFGECPRRQSRPSELRRC